MQNIMSMQTLQAQQHLYKNIPNLILLKKSLRFLMINDLLVQIPIIGKLHNDTTRNYYSYHRFLPSRNTYL